MIPLAFLPHRIDAPVSFTTMFVAQGSPLPHPITAHAAANLFPVTLHVDPPAPNNVLGHLTSAIERRSGTIIDRPGQLGWRRSLRPGVDVMVSSWGRTVATSKFRVSPTTTTAVERAAFPIASVSMHRRNLGPSTTTPHQMVFGTWWLYDVSPLLDAVAEVQGLLNIHKPAPAFSGWAYAVFDANPANICAHNMVPWPASTALPSTGVDCRYVAMYARQLYTAFLHILEVVETILSMNAHQTIGQYGTAADVATLIGLIGQPGDAVLGDTVMAMLRDLRSRHIAPQDMDASLFPLMPSLPLVYDFVQYTGVGGDRTYPARIMTSANMHPFAFAPLDLHHPEGAPYPNGLNSLQVDLAPVFEAHKNREAQQIRNRSPQGQLRGRGAGIGAALEARARSGGTGKREPGPDTIAGRRLARRRAREAAQATQATPAAPVAPKELQEAARAYFLNPQVRGMAEMVLLAVEHADALRRLYAENPATN